MQPPTDVAEPPPEHFDVLIVGAGISGIGMAHELAEKFPGKRYAIVETRDRIGGTWDLFRYPGIRSDTDMHTLGYRFRPWPGRAAIADGAAIREYVEDTARAAGADRHIRFGHRVTAASFSSADARWTVTAERLADGTLVTLTCSFLFGASGYYRYDEGYTPRFEGRETFEGQLIHPQHWPEDLDYAGKRVVVIGSGATAVTLVPALAERAAHVTMLQRSPSYILALPEADPLAALLGTRLPERGLYSIIRTKNILLATAFYKLCRRFPRRMRRLLQGGVRRRLPPGYPIDQHFTPTYDPWDQRVCLVPGADLFEAITRGDASVVTDHIDRFVADGIRLRSGAEIRADIVVTATGLNLLPLGGIEFSVDGARVDLPSTWAYKGMMLSGVPNFAFAIGYTNASWTLKAGLTFDYVCRLLQRMDDRGELICVPQAPGADVTERPLLDFQAGYVKRTIAAWPRGGSAGPYRLRQNYLRDVQDFRRGPLDEQMRFSTARPEASGAADQTSVAGVA